MKKSFSKNTTVKCKSSRNHRGVALVFTLGILGLLAVLALGFASTALLNLKISENTSNIIYAQNIARSIALARGMYGVVNNLDFSKIYSSSTDTNLDWLWKLDTKLSGTEIFKYESTSNVRWQYVKDPNNNKILGRFAYVVVPDKGRLDPSVNIANGTGIDGASEKQVGINNPTWSGSPGLLSNAVTGNYRWTTFWEIFNQLGSNITTAQKTTFFADGINVGQLKSPEAYWAGEFYRRFNLNRSDWGTITVSDLVGSGNTAFSSSDTVDVMKGIPWLKNWNDKLTSLYPSPTTDSDKEKAYMAKQIAANIIQYNRAETSNTVTDLVDSADWTATAPAYAGVGKHPMLNEMGYKFNTQATLTASPYPDATTPTAYDYTLTYVFNVSFGAELIDMFGIVGTKADSEIALTNWAVNATYAWVDVSKGTGSSPLTFNNYGQFGLLDTAFNSATEATVEKTNTIAGATGWNTSYTKSGDFWKMSTVTKTLTFRIAQATDHSALIKAGLKIKNISITPGRAVLKYNSKQRDFANLPTPTVDVTEYDAKVERTFSYALETNDPRVNHYSTDWKDVKLPTGTAGALQVTTTEAIDYGGSIGTCNTLSGINDTDRDKGTTADPGYEVGVKRISSAFIRNGTMQSVWELGCISRAEAWRTLNLTRTNNASSPDYTYAKGDGLLLDQVKLTDSTRPEGPNFKYGKVNINSDVTPVFRALVDDTRFPWYNSDFETGNTAQTNLLSVTTGTNLNTTTNPIVANTYPHASTCECIACLIQARSKILPFYNRSELLVDVADVANLPGYSALTVANQTALTTNLGKLRARLLSPLQYLASPPSGSDSTTKAAQEQLIGKIIPLLKTEPSDMVYVIVLAQTIRDVGGTPAYIDWNGDGAYSASNVSDAVSLKKAGFIRTGESVSCVTGASVAETYAAAATAIGTYEIGADKITSEAKLVAVLVQDPITRKWRIARYQYVE